MQPLQYDSRPSAAKDNGIPQTAAARNLDGATTVRSAETELQSSIELCAMAPEIAGPKCPNPNLGGTAQKKGFEALCHLAKGILKRKSPAPRLRKPGGKSLSELCCSHSNTIYDAQLENTKVYCVHSRSSEEPSCSHDIAFCGTTRTFMQPLQCVLQHHVASPLASMHMATEDDNNHAAIPLRSAAADSKTP